MALWYLQAKETVRNIKPTPEITPFAVNSRYNVKTHWLRGIITGARPSIISLSKTVTNAPTKKKLIAMLK